MLGKVRRVVMGHDANGQSVLVEDAFAPVIHTQEWRPGWAVTELWKTDATPASLGNNPDITAGPMRFVPPKGGSAFRILEIPPETPEFRARLAAGATGTVPPTAGGGAGGHKAGAPHPAMHRTETLDYGIVLSGEIHAILDGAETILKAGDVIVQCGTNHAWSNRSDKPCRMAFVMIDGKFDPGLSEKFK